MCGRYAASKDADGLVEEFEVVLDATDGVVPDFNVAPTKQAPVVLSRPVRGSDSPSPVRQLRSLTWGLVPSWSKDRKGGARMINARIESVATTGAFRKAATSRRCLVPADGWFEWRKEDGIKQPYFMTRTDGATTAFAGIYEFWRDPAVANKDDPSAWLISYSILTQPAEPAMSWLHDRMPVVVEPADYPLWLESGDQQGAELAELLDHLRGAPNGRFTSAAVGVAVNRSDATGPELIRPIDG